MDLLTKMTIERLKDKKVRPKKICNIYLNEEDTNSKSINRLVYKVNEIIESLNEDRKYQLSQVYKRQIWPTK